MSSLTEMNRNQVEPVRPAQLGWWVVASRELRDLWFGGRAMILLILFSIFLGVMSFLLATNNELSLIPPKEMVFMMLQNTIAVGLFIGLILGADSISGERERSTFEGLLLTPVKRRQIVLGKFITALSPWPAALIISAAYLAILAPNSEVWGQAMLWGTLLGTLLVAAFIGLGMLVSIRTNSNKTSLTLSLAFYVLFYLPTQFAGAAQTGSVGRFIKRVNPLEATNQFLEKVLVNNRTPDEMASWLLAPVLFAALALGLLFWLEGPGIRLDGGRTRLIRLHRNRIAGLSVAVLFAAALGAPHLAASAGPDPVLDIAINLDYKEAKTGDQFEFETIVTNNGMDQSAPLVVAMNIVNLGDGDPVDPEDWSPMRTQSVAPLTPGQSATQTWTIHAILEGDYLVYMVVIPTPDEVQVTSQPVASSGIHLTVHPFVRLNPGGVLPLAIGMPTGLTLSMVLLLWFRRRGIDAGSAG